ncbi:hypothetical protein T484DRAFT_1763255 [Baffinella frigidus]|nr:hypothetical protein T484DRAFT_1763255 [Cryptophyta sp. CCMP2293]
MEERASLAFLLLNFASLAFLLLNFVPLDEQPLKITHLVPAGSTRYAARATLFVSRIAPEVSEHDLWWAFKFHGSIMSVTIPREKLTQAHSPLSSHGASKCVGFIRFCDWPSAEKALHLMDGQLIAGREIAVRYAPDAILPPHLIGTPWQTQQRAKDVANNDQVRVPMRTAVFIGQHTWTAVLIGKHTWTRDSSLVHNANRKLQTANRKAYVVPDWALDATP